ncbi:hypothetical protein BCT75_04255 [Vibrio lentus]|uniref:hypothetical protein n=1 Tax=Vibrio lentus TaxID=136468 RepID=UPI000C82351A|nr:hypothetical protein [Vibrio lentus]PML45602.1 hypothetical protein BCT75_04255 [Vibrio lentus]
MADIGFIACAKFEDTVKAYGEGSTPELALSDFLQGGDFQVHCESNDIEDEDHVEVKVFKAIYADTPEANMDDFEDGWKWILGEEVSEHKVQFLA